MWKSAGRPSNGALYDTYKYTRKSYKKACRQAIKLCEKKTFNDLDNLCTTRRSKDLWNKIGEKKQFDTTQPNCANKINISALEKYFTDKFCEPNYKSV